jgi:hypothetical protein
MAQQWDEVLGRPELAGLVLEAARGCGGGGGRSGSNEQATQAAHRLCLASAACRQAVLGVVERAAAREVWAREHAAALGAMTALASLCLTGDQGVDPAQLPPLPRLTSLECSLRPGAEAAAAWPGLGGLRQLALDVGTGGGLPPALLQLPRLTCLQAQASCWDALRLIEQLTGVSELDITCVGKGEEGGLSYFLFQQSEEGEGERHLRLENLCGLTSLSVHCRSKHLPDSLGQLPALRNLDLGDCSSLQQLPKNLGQLSQLSSLGLGGCRRLKQLPHSLSQLATLRSLDLRGCMDLQQLPDSLGQLSALRSLNLGGCSSLQQLPDNLGQLLALRSLDMCGCSGLQQLPESLGQLAALRSLDMRGCSRLQQLPDSLG